MQFEDSRLAKILNTEFKDRRNFLRYVAKPLIAFVAHYYEADYEGLENTPKVGPALFLQKHTSWQEIPYGPYAVHKATGRYPYAIMKAVLPRILEYAGGLKIMRRKDMMKFQRRGYRISERFKEFFNERVMEFVESLYQRGEIVFQWPEGHRFQKGIGRLKTYVIEKTKVAQKRVGNIPIIPVGIEFENLYCPRSKLYVRVGEQILVPPDYPIDSLTKKIHAELERLSGLR